MYPGIEDLGEDFCDEIYVPRGQQVHWLGDVDSWRAGTAAAPAPAFVSLLPPRPPAPPPTVFDVETPAQAERREDIIEATLYVFDSDARDNIAEMSGLFRSHESEPIIVLDRYTGMSRMVTIGAWVAYRITCKVQKISPTMVVATEDALRRIPWGFFTMQPLDYLPEYPRGYFDEVLKYLRGQAAVQA